MPDLNSPCNTQFRILVEKLRTCDIISLHAKMSSDTIHIYNIDQVLFGHFCKDSFLTTRIFAATERKYFQLLLRYAVFPDDLGQDVV